MHTDAILLVEDNPDDVALAVHAFRKNHLRNRIVLARDGAEAVDLLLPNDGRKPLWPLIVLLDLYLPGMGGLDVLTRLRADPATHALPVIVLTTSGLERDIAESHEFGANGYIRKPVDFDEFCTAAQALGVYWLGHRVGHRPVQNAGHRTGG